MLIEGGLSANARRCLQPIIRFPMPSAAEVPRSSPASLRATPRESLVGRVKPARLTAVILMAALLLTAVASTGSSPARAQCFPCAPTNLGSLGGTGSWANGVNTDGSVVVGISDIPGSSALHAFLWTSAGMIDLGTLGGSNSWANGVSGDGSVVVGNSDITGDSAYHHAFRWTTAKA
jgi:probable HAF family extracellular repeat protein